MKTTLQKKLNHVMFVLFLTCMSQLLHAQILDDIKTNATNTATQKTEDKSTQVTTNSLNKTDTAATNGLNKLAAGLFKKKKPAAAKTDSSGQNANANGQANGGNAAQGSTSGASAGTAAAVVQPNFTPYSNYDFVPGDKTIFEDDFTDAQEGEFPQRWELIKGQGVVNRMNGIPAFVLTDGNYATVLPRTQGKNFLQDPFTIEFDYYIKAAGGYGILLFLEGAPTADWPEGPEYIVNYDYTGNVSTSNFPKELVGNFPGNADSLVDKWHHATLIFKNKQMKCYIDQYRVLNLPDAAITPVAVRFGGLASQELPIYFKNVRIASGGGMNMTGKKFTDSRIVTHGINFDIDQATLKPQSMGTINMIAQILKDNPDLKFEIDGHTDNSGNPQHNLDLSQKRADAVKSVLVSMGIDPSRLSTKGLGDTQPISDNSTVEGKADNRRVVFVKTSVP
jgi:OmpA-OmpF porin, OOP family